MTNNKLNMYFTIILMITSMFMLISSINMISFYFSIMFEWFIITINSCNIYMTIIFDFMSTLFLSTVMFISSIVMFYVISWEIWHAAFKTFEKPLLTFSSHLFLIHS